MVRLTGRSARAVAARPSTAEAQSATMVLERWDMSDLLFTWAPAIPPARNLGGRAQRERAKTTAIATMAGRTHGHRTCPTTRSVRTSQDRYRRRLPTTSALGARAKNQIFFEFFFFPLRNGDLLHRLY